MYQPPTDNLYKFIAIFGIVLVVSSVALYVTSRKTAVEGQIEALRQIVDVTEALREMVLEIENTTALEESDKDDGQDVKVEMSMKLTRNIIDVEMNLIESYWTKERFAISDFSRGSLVAIFGFAIGIIVTFYGFCLWYLKTQRYQDSILRKQAESADEKTPSQ
ncbi:hypothetical protein HED60_19280 [Planctomycetales bacterium ZRK34]|nr:hypothetical protein HED60_19280 [Planctomycetales bacterium ZRK34]